MQSETNPAFDHDAGHGSEISIPIRQPDNGRPDLADVPIAPSTGLDVAGRHPSVQHFAEHFAYHHLRPGPVQDTKAMFADLAQTLVNALPDSPELSAALRGLWEASNSAVLATVIHLKAGGPDGREEREKL